MPGGMPPIPPPMPGGIPPGGPPAPPPDPPPFDAITSSTLSNIVTASVADLTTCFFTRSGSTMFSFHISAVFPVYTLPPNHVLAVVVCCARVAYLRAQPLCGWALFLRSERGQRLSLPKRPRRL